MTESRDQSLPGDRGSYREGVGIGGSNDQGALGNFFGGKGYVYSLTAMVVLQVYTYIYVCHSAHFKYAYGLLFINYTTLPKKGNGFNKPEFKY